MTHTPRKQVTSPLIIELQLDKNSFLASFAVWQTWLPAKPLHGAATVPYIVEG